ncbi:MAG: hypothetical protein ACTSVY_01445, partial [Candidatus Helarchaeota archaeon]
NLNLNLIKRINENDENELFIRKFFDYLPSMMESSKIRENKPELILKAMISELFLRSINEKIQNYELKTGKYFVPICFNDKWPYDIELFKKYFSQESKSKKVTKGICEGCGKQGELSKGLFGEIGFYTIDQNSFKYPFLGNLPYQLCEKCKFYAEKGFDYVKNNLKLYLGSRGPNKPPFEMYVIPIIDEIDDLPSVLKKIKFSVEQRKDVNGIKHAANAALSAKESQLSDETKLNVDKESEKKIDEPKGRLDLTNMFSNIIEDFFEKKRKRIRFSLLFILFYHPEGQSSMFHNIISIDFMDYERIIKLGEAIRDLENSGERFYFRDLYHEFGVHKFRVYLSKFLNLSKMSLSTLCKDAYINSKKDFFQFMADPNNPPKYIRSNLRNLNSFIKITRSLNLL